MKRAGLFYFIYKMADITADASRPLTIEVIALRCPASFLVERLQMMLALVMIRFRGKNFEEGK